MPYIAILLVNILSEVARLTAAILGISSGGGGGGGTVNRVKEFYNQSGVVSGQNYQHNFQASFGVSSSSYRLRVRGWDADGFEVYGIRAQPVDDNNAQLILDDTGTPFSGDLEFYLTLNPA